MLKIMDNLFDNISFNQNQSESLVRQDVLNDVSIFKLKHYDYLNHIIRQVNKDGFYAVRCAQFMQNNHLNSEELAFTIKIVNRWAGKQRLTTSFNHFYGICVFEHIG